MEKKGLIWLVVGIAVFYLIISHTDFSQTYSIIGTNLIQNPGFETDDYWYEAGGDSTHILSKDTTTAHTGSNSLALEVVNSNEDYFNWHYYPAYPDEYIQIEQEDYVLQFWYKTENLPIGSNIVIGIHEFDANKNELEINDLWLDASGTTDWRELTTGWNPKNPNTEYINFGLFLVSTNGKVWYDDIILAEGTVDEESTLNYFSGIRGVCENKNYDDVAGMKELGISMVRTDVAWNAVETQEGVYDFSSYDSKFAPLFSNGIEPLIILDYSNCNSWTPWDCGTTPAHQYIPTDAAEWNSFKEEYGDYVYNTVLHYKGEVKYFEIWNEPNLDTYWQPSPDSEKYTELLKIAYTRAKQANSNAIILAPAASSTDLVFIDDIYSNGGKNYFDIMSIHPYCWGANPKTASCWNIYKIDNLINLMQDYGDGNKPIWISEFGFTTTVNSEQEQADYLKGTLEILETKYPEVKAFFWYDYKDDCTDTSNAECNFGLVRTDLSKKPSYIAYRDFPTNSGTVVCTQDVKQCPDGSYVGRNPNNNCEFYACPTTEEPTETNQFQEIIDELISLARTPLFPIGDFQIELWMLLAIVLIIILLLD